MSPRCAVFALALLLPDAAQAVEPRRWELPSHGLTFEVSAVDLRVSKDAGAPVFSLATLLAAKKKEFDDDAQEQAREAEGPEPPPYGDSTSYESVTFEVLSVVGPLLAYRESSGGSSAGAAHPTRYEVVRMRDLARPGAEPRLLDLFPEKQVLAALKADRFVRKFANPERGFEQASSVAELVAALDPEWAQEHASDEDHDCSVDLSFDESFGRMFYFHHVEKDRVAVRILVPPGSEWCNRANGPEEVGLLLPVPEGLRQALAQAESGSAGFLAASRKAFGPPPSSASWKVDIRTLAGEK